MNHWERLKGLKPVLKKVKFIYEPYRKYRKIKDFYVIKKKNKALHQDGVVTISTIEKALTEYGITYFADYGTLLGIIRDHDFIQWDSDLDYGIIIDDNFDWNKFERHMNQHGFNKIREFSYLGKIKEQTYEKNILTVDFFGKSYENNQFAAYGFIRKPDYQYQSEHEFHVRRRYYAPIKQTKKVPFLGTSVTVPSNAEEYLESVYTINWRIPNADWDVAKEDKLLEELSVLGYGEVKR